jgi:hypothetical protein
MKLFYLVSLFLFMCLSIAVELESYIVIYPYGTPESIKSQAKELIKAGGGTIGYEYSRFLPFAFMLSCILLVAIPNSPLLLKT